MSLPNSADFALIETLLPSGYTILCGIEQASISRTVNTTESYRRDCDKPNKPGQRKLKATSKSFSISGSGFGNVDLESEYASIFGKRNNYRIALYKDDGTDGGLLIGYYYFTGIMTVRNQSWTQDGDAGTTEITLEGEGELVWSQGVLPIGWLSLDNGVLSLNNGNLGII